MDRRVELKEEEEEEVCHRYIGNRWIKRTIMVKKHQVLILKEYCVVSMELMPLRQCFGPLLFSYVL